MELQDKIIEICRKYLLGDRCVKGLSESIKRSINRGFTYQYEKNSLSFHMELFFDEEQPFCFLFGYPNIPYIPREKFATAAKYCQANSSPREPGILLIHPGQRHLCFCLSLPTTCEAPVTEETIAWMNSYAFDKLKKLDNDLIPLLSDCCIPPWETTSPDEQPRSMECRLDEVKTVLLEELKNSDYEFFGQGISEDEDLLFSLKIRTETGTFQEEIAADKTTGCLIVSLRPYFKATDTGLCFGKLALLCNDINIKSTFPGLHAYSPDRYPRFSMAIPIHSSAKITGIIKLAEEYGMNQIGRLICLTDAWKQKQDRPETYDAPEEDTTPPSSLGGNPFAQIRQNFYDAIIGYDRECSIEDIFGDCPDGFGNIEAGDPAVSDSLPCETPPADSGPGDP